MREFLSRFYQFIALSAGFVGAVSSTYSVSIISDPRQGPFRVGQAVNFSCVVDPALDDVTYQWRAVDHGRSRSFTQQNITIYYRGIYLRYCLYFCYVWQHETLINSSNLMVEIQGHVYTTGSPVMTFNRGGRLQLSVNIDSICDDNITSLAWYHNETRISSGRKFTISNHDTVLTGINMVSSDAGVYEVRISFNAICTDELVNYTSSLVPGCVLLQPETLAFIAPVTFIVQENCLPTYNPLRVVNVKYIYDESSHNITELRSTAHTNMSHRYNWYRNGLQLADSEIYITEGNYIGIQWSDTAYWLSQCSQDAFSVARVPYVISYWSIRLHNPPSSVHLNFQQADLTQGRTTGVECRALDGEPSEAFNLTLSRNNESLIQVNGDYLRYTTEPYSYGTYKCTIGSIQNTSILRERAPFHMLLGIAGSNTCDGGLMNLLNNSLKDVFVTMCPSCDNIDAADIENVQVNCTGSGEFAYLTADLVYSDSEGRLTASTLLDMLLIWMLSQDNPSIMVDGLRVALSKQCPIQLNAVTGNACVDIFNSPSSPVTLPAPTVPSLTVPRPTVPSQTVPRPTVPSQTVPAPTLPPPSVGTSPLTIAVLFGGLAAGIVIAIVALGIILCCIKCLNSLNKPTVREDIEGVQIAMGVNQAYEAVSKDNLNGEEIRQEQEQEEHIYDVAV